ncbi:MAG TPA: sulfotransferase, partial [Burkholderiaceae bacterium]
RLSLAGKTILLYGEQGLGDILQFIRYARSIAQRGATVHVLVPQALQTLIASCPGVSAVFTSDRLLAPFDYHCALMSLPLLCGTELSSIPAETPYLSSSAEKQAWWRERIGQASRASLHNGLRTGLRVGLVWAGNPRKHDSGAHAADRLRSLRFEQIAPLLDVEGVEFYSLQLGEEAVAQLNGDPRVIDLTADLHDFEDTAAFVSNLDLVISVDTSVVHLTGAIGKPVWILNRYNTCWRWLAEGMDSPWYPTARLFRQSDFGDWDGVVADAKRALSELACAHRANPAMPGSSD